MERNAANPLWTNALQTKKKQHDCSGCLLAHHAADSRLPRKQNLGRAEAVLLGQWLELWILHKRMLLTKVLVEVGYAKWRI